MKLTSIKNKIFDSIGDLILSDCGKKIYNSISYDTIRKIDDEIYMSNLEIDETQRTTLNNLKNEIN